MQEIIYEWKWWDRIDSRLSGQFSYSRNFFHHIIERWWIQVNSKVVKKSYKLKSSDKVQIDELERYLSPIILDEAEEIDIPIIREEEDYIIINKPKWVLSHPNSIRDAKKPSVVAFLYQHYKDLPSYGNFIRAWLVHRLDKDTDWLMIVAKTEKWLQHFKSLFQDKSESSSLEEKESTPLQKYYRATCEITPKWAEFLDEMKKNWLPYYIQETVIAKVPNCTSKMWITKVLSFEKVWDWLVKLQLQILTWRTHQIRYHLSNHWLPIQWDYLYGKENENVPMQLTAWKLEYLDLNGKTQVVEI
jgi:23S rRNA pseudouridine1911/1915/1917 synthase